MKIPFTVLYPDGTTTEGAIRDVGRDPVSYEDHFRESYEGAMHDDAGGLRSTWFHRAAWIALRARHGERRTFDEWLDVLDDDDAGITIGHASESTPTPGPTGETPTPPDAESPVSPPEPESTQSDSPPSPSTTKASSRRSRPSSTSSDVSASASGDT